jgi:Tol biopolymer transport system component
MDAGWSPDGKRIVFGRVPFLPGTTDKIAIMIFDLGTKQVTTIPGSETLYAPRWSPDGSHLAALSADSKKVMLFDFKTQKWMNWVNSTGSTGSPSWSKDGMYVYYDDLSPQGTTYRRVKIGQTHSELVADLKDVVLFTPMSTVTPDGSGLFTRDLGTDEIYSLDVDLP